MLRKNAEVRRKNGSCVTSGSNLLNVDLLNNIVKMIADTFIVIIPSQYKVIDKGIGHN